MKSFDYYVHPSGRAFEGIKDGCLYVMVIDPNNINRNHILYSDSSIVHWAHFKGKTWKQVSKEEAYKMLDCQLKILTEKTI